MQLRLLSIFVAVVQCTAQNNFLLSDDEDINDENGSTPNNYEGGSGIGSGEDTTTEGPTPTYIMTGPVSSTPQTTVVLSTYEVDVFDKDIQGEVDVKTKILSTPKPLETTPAVTEDIGLEPQKPEGILKCLTNTDCQFWGAKYFLAALLGGAIVGFLIIGIVIIFICHTVKKRDQGTYVVKEKYTAGQAAPPSYQYGTQKGNEEFYA